MFKYCGVIGATTGTGRGIAATGSFSFSNHLFLRLGMGKPSRVPVGEFDFERTREPSNDGKTGMQTVMRFPWIWNDPRTHLFSRRSVWDCVTALLVAASHPGRMAVYLVQCHDRGK